MSTPLSLLARLGRMTGLRDVLDVGGGVALFYVNSPPATPNDATAELLLGTVTLASPSGAVGAAGPLATLTLTVPRVNLASASGVIGWVRLADGAGHGLMDLAVGLAGSGAPVIVNATQVYTGGEIQLISCVLSE
jgi:hypothetical protein